MSLISLYNAHEQYLQAACVYSNPYEPLVFLSAYMVGCHRAHEPSEEAFQGGRGAAVGPDHPARASRPLGTGGGGPQGKTPATAVSYRRVGPRRSRAYPAVDPIKCS